MRQIRIALTLALAATLAMSAPMAAGSAPPASTDGTAAVDWLDTSSAIVVLKADPLATYDGKIKGYEKTRPDRGKVNPNSAAAKKYLGYLKQQHSEFQRWLQRNVPSAKITSEYFTVLNAVAVSLNGNAIGRLAQNADVLTVEYNALYRPDMSESYKIIQAEGAWTAAGGRARAGTGVKVGVIDSGIDSTHPFFNPAGFSYPTTGGPWPKCDANDSSTGQADSNCKYTTPKVIVAKVFNNKQNQNGFDANPIPEVGDHGTHVSGTVAGVTGVDAVVEGVTIDDMSGVAPAAWLGNYNVFPGDVESARSEDILNAVEAAVLDGMDVLNLSLGGGYRGNNDLLAKGLDMAVAAGVVVVASAGNNGPGPFTIGSPGRARDIITVGASTNQHFVGQPIEYDGPSGSGTVRAAKGDFDALNAGTFALVDTASRACRPGTPGTNSSNNPPLPDLTGKLAVINRGSCIFSEKVAAAKVKNAAGVIVVNNVAGDPIAMGRTDGFDDDIPAVMIGKDDGAALRASGATSVTVASDFAEFVPTGNEDILAGFSSQGPTFVDYAIKPDLTSVGVNVLSSIVCGAEGTTCGGDGTWAFFQGTSMSAPHIAGSAAVLLDLNDSWSPAQVKSALVNTADLVAKNAFDASTTVGPMAQGGGRENLTAASEATISLSPVSASFGRINASRVNQSTLAITLSNSTASSQSFTLSALRFTPSAGSLGSAFNAGTTSAGDPRISFPSSVTLAAGGSTTLTVGVDAGLANGTVVQGWILLDGSDANTDPDYRFAYWAEVAP